MNSVLRLLILLLLLPFFAGCNWDDTCEDLKLYKIGLCDEPEPDYFDVGITYNKLMRDPALFCDYAASHAATFTDKFESCGVHHINRLNDEINDTQSYCESIFIDPADILWCENKYGAGALSGQVVWLTGMMEVTNQINNCSLVNCDCALLGSYLQLMVDLWNAEMPTGQTWQQVMDEALPAYKTAYACE